MSSEPVVKKRTSVIRLKSFEPKKRTSVILQPSNISPTVVLTPLEVAGLLELAPTKVSKSSLKKISENEAKQT